MSNFVLAQHHKIYVTFLNCLIDKFFFQQTRAGWRTFFYITGGINIFGIIVYCAFGSGNRQKWGYEPAITETDKAKESK